MTTRPITYEISVDGAEGASRAFTQLSGNQAQLSRGFGELNRGVAAVTQAMQQISPAAGAAGSAIHAILDGANNLVQGGLNPLTIATTAITTAVSLGTIAFTSYQQRLQHVREEAARLNEMFGQTEAGTIRQYLATSYEEMERAHTAGNEQAYMALSRARESQAARLRAIDREQAERDAAEARENAERNGNEQFRDEQARTLAEQNWQITNQENERQRLATERAQRQAAARASQAQHQAETQQSIDEAGDAEAGYTAYLQREEEQRSAVYQQELALRTQMHERAIEQQIATQEQLNTIQEQEHQNQLTRLQQQRQAHEQLSQEIQGYAQPLVSGFVGAMSKVIAGTESAGDAFKGLLSSFLEFISQQAALKAAFEFAESLVALASFNYPGAAMHAAAGVAFTAVAVAAGAGAVATAPSSGAPASPAANQAPQGGGPSVTNIYWNSPVVTAQDHAELGRSLGQLQSRSAQRQSSSV